MAPKIQQKDKKPSEERAGRGPGAGHARVEGESSTVTRPPRLNFVPTGQNNWFEFKRAAEVYFESKFGYAGQCLANDEHWTPKQPKRPSAEALKHDKAAGGLLRETYLYEFKKAHDDLSRAEAEYPKMFAELWDLLSLGSQSVVKTHAGYAEAKAARDPLLLFRAIKATHQGSLLGTAQIDVVEANRRYHSLSQGASEHTEAFKRRVDAAISSLEAAGSQVPAQDVQAHTYLSQLADNRYASLKTYLSNESALGNDLYPDNLEAAHALALRWKIPGVAQAGRTAGHFSDAVVMLAADGPPPAAPQPKSERGDKRDAKKPRGKKRKERQGDDKPGGDGCHACGEAGHWVRDCPHVKAVAQAAKKKSATTKTSLVMVDSVAEPDEVVFVHETGSPEGGCQGCPEPPPVHTMVAGVESGPREVLLDNQSTVHLFTNEELVSNVRPAARPIRVSGVGGIVSVDKVGDFGSFGEVYVSEASPANVLSFSAVRKQLRVSYEYDADVFSVHAPEGTMEFVPFDSGSESGHLYAYNVPYPESVLVQTVEERMKLYSRRQVAAAEAARDLERVLGYPSAASMIKMINTGALIGSAVTAQDVQRAHSIWGPSVEALKGKTKTRAPARAVIEHVPAPVEREQAIHADILFLDGEPHLIGVSMPLGLTVTKFLSARTAGVLSSALADVVGQLRARGFEPKTLLSDGEKGIAKVANSPAVGLVFNPAGPGQHVPIVENKIRQLKERMRAVLSGLPYALPPFLMKWALQYCVTRLNMVPSGTRVDPTSPRELFLGRKINAKTDLRISFGEYVQAHNPNTVKNSMEDRTMGAIALFPTGNLQGSVKFYCLATKSIITRDQWTVLPMPSVVVDLLNSLAGPMAARRRRDPVFARGDISQLVDAVGDMDGDKPTLAALPEEPPRFVPVPLEPVDGAQEVAPEQPVVEARQEAPSPLPDNPIITSGEDTSGEPVIEAPGSTDYKVPESSEVPRTQSDGGYWTPTVTSGDVSVESRPEELSTGVNMGMDEDVVGHTLVRANTPVEGEYAVEEVPAAPPETRYPTRRNRTTWREKSLDYGLHMSIPKAKQKYGDEADVAIDKELLQMLDLHVWEEVDPATITSETMKWVIFSLLFLKAKYTPDGEFQKLKARLVANGSQQDKSVYESVSSPAVSLSSLFICAGIAARERRHVVTMDIVGAYLKVDMGDKAVHVRLPAYVAARLVKLRPSLKGFLLKDGTMVVRLKKAMYGCVESARLLFLRICDVLKEMGFEANPYDECVFNKGKGADQCTIVLYVDDIMVTCANATAIDEVIAGVRKAFGTIEVHRGPVQSYLGMTMDFSEPGACIVSMEGYTADIVRAFGVDGKAASPAGDNLFTVRDNVPPLDKRRKEAFHSAVAKALYLAKRVRPETLVAVSFLTTRVQAPDEDDWMKLERLYKYLAGEPNLSLVLRFH
ncbi:MAG: reverse transcriptase domain-containing protein, partial [Ferrimicrobium sp.]